MALPSLTPTELAKRMAEGRPPVIVDLFPGQVFEKRHLPGAKNACVFEVDFPDQIQAVVDDVDAEILVYGQDQFTHDAKAALEKLERMGFENVRSLQGGIAAWILAGHEVRGSDPEGVDELDRWLDLKDGTWRVDPRDSVVHWIGRSAGIRHWGRAPVSGGEMTVEKGLFSGRFVVDMTRIQNTNLAGDPKQPTLIRHLKSDDFFFVDRFPEAVFDLEGATLYNPPEKTRPNFHVNGRLTLRGIQAPLSFDATANPGTDGGVLVEADLNLDRTDWGVIYGSSRFFQFLTYHLVYDLVGLEVRLVLVPVG
jgi:polyisoprenoid-binding protein YceI/rhodanese-related sulfurtransferase